jgi:hypothetical protein
VQALRDLSLLVGRVSPPRARRMHDQLVTSGTAPAHLLAGIAGS